MKPKTSIAPVPLDQVPLVLRVEVVPAILNNNRKVAWNLLCSHQIASIYTRKTTCSTISVDNNL